MIYLKSLLLGIIRKFVADVNEKGNTGGNFIDLAAQNEFLVSDLGTVVKQGEGYVWNVDGVGRLIEQNDATLFLEEE